MLQTELLDSNSVLSQYKRLVELRSEPAFQWGMFEWGGATSDVIYFVRHTTGRRDARYLIALNLGNNTSTTDLTFHGASCSYVEDCTSDRTVGWFT